MNCRTCNKPMHDLGDGEWWCDNCNVIDADGWPAAIGSMDDIVEHWSAWKDYWQRLDDEVQS